jgi:hypothetical protein
MQRKNGDVSTVHWRALPFLLEPRHLNSSLQHMNSKNHANHDFP